MAPFNCLSSLINPNALNMGWYVNNNKRHSTLIASSSFIWFVHSIVLIWWYCIFFSVELLKGTWYDCYGVYQGLHALCKVELSSRLHYHEVQYLQGSLSLCFLILFLVRWLCVNMAYAYKYIRFSIKGYHRYRMSRVNSLMYPSQSQHANARTSRTVNSKF